MTKFAIATTQRTGATFFSTCLDSHPRIRCPGTIFPQVTKLKFFQVDRPDSAYYKYHSSSVQRQLAHWFQRRKLIYEFLEGIYASPDGSAAVGYKTSYNHLQRYPVVIDWFKEHDVRIIHYIRSNLLKRFLSSKTNRLRRVPHSTRPVEPVKVHVDLRELEKDLARVTRLIDKYRTRFADGPYLEVLYESFAANRDVETRRVLQFLEVDEFVSLETNLVKLNPDSLAQIIENYEEIAQGLRGTAFEKYLAM